MELNIFFTHKVGKLSNTALLPGIHEDEPPDSIEINLLQFCEIEKIRCGVKEKISQVFFLGTREDKGGFRVKPLGCHHGRKGIKVGINMGGDDLLVGGLLCSFCHRWHHSTVS